MSWQPSSVDARSKIVSYLISDAKSGVLPYFSSSSFVGCSELQGTSDLLCLAARQIALRVDMILLFFLTHTNGLSYFFAVLMTRNLEKSKHL
jgi:hypothetical protein